MGKIYTLLSDYKLENELINCLISRDLEQKFWYLDKGAKLYYDIVQIDEEVFENQKSITAKDIENFGIKHCFKKNKTSTFISLGCGSGFLEKTLIKSLGEKKYDIRYIGVDSSKKMVGLAQKNIKEPNIEKYFICADFGSEDFKEFLNNNFGTEKRENVFGFLGNTFGNINHNKIMTILSNLLEKKDKIWISICLSGGETPQEEYKDYEIYKKRFKLPETQKFTMYILEEHGIKKEQGELSFEIKKIPFLNAKIYQFKFILNQKVTIRLMGKKITLLPNEEINLFKIYTYGREGIINFFKEYGFEYIAEQNKGIEGQFLFQKNN